MVVEMLCFRVASLPQGLGKKPFRYLATKGICIKEWLKIFSARDWWENTSKK